MRFFEKSPSLQLTEIGVSIPSYSAVTEIVKFFNDSDIERGYIEVCNRKGVIEEFPLTSISIGVVVADKKRFSNTLEIGEIGAQVKHIAKTTMGSSYAIDRREEY